MTNGAPTDAASWLAWIGFATVFAAAQVVAAERSDPPSSRPEPTTERPLLRDPHFREGVVVWSPQPGKHVRSGLLQAFNSKAEPIWGLAQWHSHYDLGVDAENARQQQEATFRDAGKSITFSKNDREADLVLAINGKVEYGGKLPAPGEPWPHLLLEQPLTPPPKLADMGTLRFRLRYRLLNPGAERERLTGWDDRRHAAQFLFYVTVQDLNRSSAGFGDYYWFGLRLYDIRHPWPPELAAGDRGTGKKQGTNKFMFLPEAKRYLSRSPQDGEWVTVDADLLPWIDAGLEMAWQRNYLANSRQRTDFALAVASLGWEVTAPVDVAVQVRDLELTDTRPAKAAR